MPDRAVVGRHDAGVAAGHRRQLRARAAVDRHRVDVPLAGMHFARRQVEMLLVLRQRRRFDFPLPLRELPRRARGRGRVERVEMHPAVALGEEPEMFLIRHPAERRRRPGPKPPASRIQASSCSASTTRVLPDSGSSATSQRSLLSAARAFAITIAPSSEHERHAPADLALRCRRRTRCRPRRFSRWSRFITASSRLSCASPTIVRPVIGST